MKQSAVTKDPLDTAKTAKMGGARQIISLQNSQIHGRKVDSPRIYVHENDMGDFRPKTSAQNNRKIKAKRSKINPVSTPANLESKNKKKPKPSQSTSGSQLQIASRKPPKQFDFALCQEEEIPTDRDWKRDNDSSQIIGLSKYK